MASLNKVLIIGNVGGEPQMRFTPSGKQVTSFNVATNNRYKDANGESREETEWFSVVCWGKLAELCNQYLKKGSLVFVEGRNKTRSWDKDGEKHYKTELIGNKVVFLDKQTAEVDKSTPEAEEITPEDLPF